MWNGGTGAIVNTSTVHSTRQKHIHERRRRLWSGEWGAIVNTSIVHSTRQKHIHERRRRRLWSGEWGATAKSTVRYGRGTYVPCNTQDNEKRFEKKKKKKRRARRLWNDLDENTCHLTCQNPTISAVGASVKAYTIFSRKSAPKFLPGCLLSRVF